MTKKLIDLFNLPNATPLTDVIIDTADLGVDEDEDIAVKPDRELITAETVSTLDKINSALPEVRGLEASDNEMDALANKAVASYEDLMELGMNVEARFSSDIFSSAGTMLGHAITAKTAKINKKLKMLDLQLKKAKLDHDRGDTAGTETSTGRVLDRNELIAEILQQQKLEKGKKK